MVVNNGWEHRFFGVQSLFQWTVVRAQDLVLPILQWLTAP